MLLPFTLWQGLSFSEAFCFCRVVPVETILGLRSPDPRFLSFLKERNQRFAKEEVSSLETPLLPAVSCFSVCGPENGQSPFFELFARTLWSSALHTVITFLSRGKTAPLLSALFYFFVCGPENGQSPFSQLSARTFAGLRSPHPRFLSSRKESNLGRGLSKPAIVFAESSENETCFILGTAHNKGKAT